METMTLAEYRAKFRSVPEPKKKKKTKYNSVSVVKKEIRFDSKLEGSYFEYLLSLKKEGIISYFLRQVPFHLPGNIKYLVDFVVFYPDNVVRYIDIKGVMTQVSLNKIKQVIDIFPVKIEILTKEDLKLLKVI